MSVLDGMKQWKGESSTVFITVTNYGITFSKSSVVSLDYPKYVNVYTDEKKKLFAIEKSDQKGDYTKTFVNNRDSKNAHFVRWNDKKMMECIAQIAGIDASSEGYRANGKYIEEEGVILYDLSHIDPIRGN